MNLPPPSASNANGGGPDKIYRAGTLTYTKPALAILLVWLFWGDFCYTVMEAVTGPIMQLKFKALDASNSEIGLIVTAIPTGVYSLLNPIISFKSDRFRSRWGRRIPFILFSLPFLVIFLFCLAFGSQVGTWLHDHVGFLSHAASANQIIIYTYGVLLVVFTFFNTFVTSTFWYLFNDVVPEHLLARFMSWFRAISLLSTSFYNFLIFPYSQTHATEIFIGAALLYLVGFGLMCTNVKEGKYPPPAPYVGGQTGPVAAVATYFKETHAFRHYWWMWICTFLSSIGGGVNTFVLFFQLSLSLTMFQIGKINGILQLTVGVMTIGAGWLADRYHPIRVVMIGWMIGLFCVTPISLIWLFWHPTPIVVFWVILTISIVLSAPSQALGGMGDPPMLMRLFPRSHYGQFCSTNAVWRSIGGILGSVLAGAYLDFLSHGVGRERAYYFLPFWSLCFGLPSFYCLCRLYLSWKKHGGDDDYIAPVLPTAAVPAPTGLMPVMPEMDK